MNLSSNSKWVSSGKNAWQIKFRCCENNIETIRYFKITLPLFQVLQKSLPISITNESIANSSVG